VASEVRSLAHRCSDAAEEINKLISDSTGQVGEGVSLMDRTNDALGVILEGIRGMSKNVSEIAVSAQEQSNGISEINVAVEQLDRSTQQNAAMFEETTAASQSLTSESGQLAELVAGFKVAQDAEATDETQKEVA
jgi:methyl-accepting chemotaxis protein